MVRENKDLKQNKEKLMDQTREKSKFAKQLQEEKEMIANRIYKITNEIEKGKFDIRSVLSQIDRIAQKQKEVNQQNENILKENKSLSGKSKTLCDELKQKTNIMEKEKKGINNF
jgi:chromosome segregation ATPase